MHKFSSSGATLAKFALGLTLAATLAACGGSDSPATIPVAEDFLGAVTASNVAALVTATPTVATFTDGFSGTDGTLAATPVVLNGLTTVAFTSGGATPTFAITNGGNTATGVTTFGSCIFTVNNNSPFASGPLVSNSVIKVDICRLAADTSGAPADGTTAVRDVNLVLGGATSEPIKLTVAVNPDKTVQIGTTIVGTVPVTTTTGGGN